MTTTPTYARFWRCALQVNPAGYNVTYRGADHGLDETAYNQAILAKCRELDIKVVGIADHGNVDAVDALRAVLEPAGIVVFPGFEIASTEKVHMVCLFPEGTTRDDLNRYLGKLDLVNSSDPVRPSSLGCLEIAHRVRDLGGFWYAAHMTGSNGLLRLDKDGGGLVHVWKDHCLVRAGQIPGPVADLPHNYRQIVENLDPNWKRERLIAVLNAKDVARPEDLAEPGATCLVKMTRPTFEAFRIAFLDPESRVRLNSEQPVASPGAIVLMRITGGYLDGVEVEFSEHLNTVIGGRGTGKSTLLECLRYVLDIPPKGRQAQRLHADIIKENLGKESGRIEVEIASSAQHRRRYRVSRRYGEPPVVRGEDGNVSNLHPRDLLPGIEIYGQNEIFELAQDEQSRLRLLDRFLPGDTEFSARLVALDKRLNENRQKIIKTQGDLDDAKARVARLPKLEEQLEGFHTLGIQEKLSRTPLFARERQLVQRVRDDLDRFSEGLTALEDSLPDATFLADQALDGLPDAAQIAPMREMLEGLKRLAAAKVQELKTAVADAEQTFARQREAWREAIDQGEGKLEKALRSLPDMAGRSGQEVGTAFQRLLKEIEQIKPLRARVETLGKLLDAQCQERRNLLAELSDLRSQKLDALRRAAKRLDQQLAGKLEVVIQPEADRSPLKRFLLDCNLEGIGERRLAWIDEVGSLTPSSLAAAIRAGEDALKAQFSLTPMVAEALARIPESGLMALEALELGDRVEIRLNVAHEDASPDFRLLHRLSTGQQCTAILHLLLLENADPLVMDQPEDNLDNAFIAERIVRELRSAKTRRQFLFATHNANIPVFGDAEWIGVFQASGDHASMGPEQQGSIDVASIRKHVTDILEGGREAFLRRQEKYEF